MNKLIIREMNRVDYDSVDELMIQLHAVHVKGRPDLYEEVEHPYTLTEFKEMVNNNNIISLIAEENDTIVGLCITSIKDKSGMLNMKTAYMDALVVSEKYQNKGYAKELFNETEKKAKSMGVARIDLMVWEFNKHAIELYASLGMKTQRYIFEKEI